MLVGDTHIKVRRINAIHHLVVCEWPVDFVLCAAENDTAGLHVKGRHSVATAYLIISRPTHGRHDLSFHVEAHLVIESRRHRRSQ